jgi:hypothetical protein
MKTLKNKKRDELKEEIEKCKDRYLEGEALLKMIRKILENKNGKFDKVGQKSQ